MASRAYQTEQTQAPYPWGRQSARDGRLQIDSLLIGDDGELMDRHYSYLDYNTGGQATIVPWSIKAEFKEHYTQWLTDSLFDSLPDRMRRHASYQAIVALGDRVVPLIASELRREPSFVFLALEEIKNYDPVPDEALGNLNATVAAWLSWLRK